MTRNFLFAFLTLAFTLSFQSTVFAQPGNTIQYSDTFGTLTLSYAGEINGRNAYESSGSVNGDVRIVWTGSRWESLAIDSFNDLLGFSNLDVGPNPPDFATGCWISGGFEPIFNITGSGTQSIMVAFALSATPACVGSPAQAGLGGGTPVGGTYSGPGVTDDGNGMTFSYDPAAAGVGNHTISYSFGCSANTVSGMVEVFALPTVTFMAPSFDQNTGAQPLSGGMPMNGTYSGTGVIDNGDGTFSFNTDALVPGTYVVTYSFTDANGCSAMAEGDVILNENI
ncbi:MAG: hypothetical protein AAFU60_12675, partial [Bacteroidota bacterium]